MTSDSPSPSLRQLIVELPGILERPSNLPAFAADPRAQAALDVVADLVALLSSQPPRVKDLRRAPREITLSADTIRKHFTHELAEALFQYAMSIFAIATVDGPRRFACHALGYHRLSERTAERVRVLREFRSEGRQDLGPHVDAAVLSAPPSIRRALEIFVICARLTPHAEGSRFMRLMLRQLVGEPVGAADWVEYLRNAHVPADIGAAHQHVASALASTGDLRGAIEHDLACHRWLPTSVFGGYQLALHALQSGDDALARRAADTLLANSDSEYIAVLAEQVRFDAAEWPIAREANPAAFDRWVAMLPDALAREFR